MEKFIEGNGCKQLDARRVARAGRQGVKNKWRS